VPGRSASGLSVRGTIAWAQWSMKTVAAADNSEEQVPAPAQHRSSPLTFMEEKYINTAQFNVQQ